MIRIQVVVPDDIGGRFSVLTAVGLLPIAAAGCDTDAMIKGMRDMRERCMSEDFAKNPALLEKRLGAKEEQSEQKLVVKLSGLMFLAAFITAGLNWRFDWLVLPFGVSAAAAVVFLIAYALYEMSMPLGEEIYK